ncbi:MAG: SDR family oxidoreductase [Pseudomonadota bacterium]
MTPPTMRFDNRVVVITGAGAGLGRSYALEFARRGAKVVVNDLGGSAQGDGADKSVAQTVVDEIIAEGGEAIANTDNVIEGGRIIENAMDTFGKIDIVINNAGILRDVSFHKMTEEDWKLIFDIHVNGAFAVTHAAWPIMRKAGYGRIINTSSAAGIYGNFGQVNYAAAKLALYGMVTALSEEGKGKGIFVNAIAPVAASRLTENLIPPEIFKALKPEFVTPLVVMLCHENSEINGELFEVGGGWISKLRWQASEGATFEPSDSFTAETLKEKWHDVEDFDHSYNPSNIMAPLEKVMKNIGTNRSSQKQDDK